MKRVTNTPHPKPILKNKNKGHSKSKQKKFNPNEYLNSLIDQLHDPRFQTVRKRPPPSHKIQRNSALAYTTPITERTITASKVRSKSSYSQYRKKSVPMREILRVDIDNAITEEDNIIHFTEQTIQSAIDPALFQSKIPNLLSPVAAARRIQRAWRKYQTLKVVRKYYKNILKFQPKKQSESEDSSGRRTNIKGAFARTLKIKKEQETSPNNKTIRFQKRTIANLQNFSQQIGSSQTKEFYRQPQQNAFQEQKTVQLISYGQESSQNQEYTSNDLKLLIDLFRGKHEIASHEIDQQLNNICRLLPQSSDLNSYPTDQSQHQQTQQFEQQCLSEGISPLIFNEMERVIREKCQLLKTRIKLSCSQVDQQQIKVRERNIEEKMIRQLKNIERCKLNYLKSMRLLRQNMIKMQVQSSKVQKIGKEVGFGVMNKVRKSYSADTLILKSILEQVNLKNFKIDSISNFHRLRPLIFLQQVSKSQDDSRQQQFLLPICPTSPPSGINVGIPSNQNSKNSLNRYQPEDNQRIHDQIYNASGISFRNSQNSQDFKQHISQFEQQQPEPRHSRSTSSINLSVNSQISREQREDSRTLIIMKQCAEEMQQKIQNSLISQIIQEIYLNQNMYKLVKPYIEKPFEFKPISDFDIISFLQVELPAFFPGPDEILLRFNQKINPNTKEILRLIRDFDYQIEEYELVLPQIVFKSYRKSVQDAYALKIRAQSQSNPLNLPLISNSMASIAEQRWKQRKQKRMKFLSFQRDLKIMYMKSIFNCYNELIIQTKSFYTFMNGRSSIGPGQLTLALREYNLYSQQIQCMSIMSEARQKVQSIIHQKCMLPVFKNYKELDQFQKQMNRQISIELGQNQFKWVNYMDQVLQIWQDVSVWVCQELTNEVVQELAIMMQLM